MSPEDVAVAVAERAARKAYEREVLGTEDDDVESAEDALERKERRKRKRRTEYSEQADLVTIFGQFDRW